MNSSIPGRARRSSDTPVKASGASRDVAHGDATDLGQIRGENLGASLNKWEHDRKMMGKEK